MTATMLDRIGCRIDDKQLCWGNRNREMTQQRGSDTGCAFEEGMWEK